VPDGISYGALGSLDVRLCRRRADVRLAQALRYDVFYREMAAVPSALARHRGRDEDRYDAVCDHLLVFDTARAPMAAARQQTGCCAKTLPSGAAASTRRANMTSSR
jgi:putative hemolysin